MNLRQRIAAAYKIMTAKSAANVPHPWAVNYWGSGGNYDSGYSGYNYNIRWDKWGAALAVKVNEALFRCVTKRSETVGTTPWNIVSTRTGEIVATNDDIDSDNPIARALHRAQKRHHESLFTLWERAAVVTGETFIEKVINDLRVPSDVEWLNPLAVYIDAPNGIIQRYRYQAHGQSVIYNPQEIVYHRIQMDMASDVNGYSPVMAAIGSDTLNILRNSARTLQAFFNNDATPRNVITPQSGSGFDSAGWNKDQIRQIQTTLQEQKGTARSYGTSIFPFPMDLEQLDMPELSHWATMLQEIEPKVYTALGVPRSVAGDSDSTRYQASPDDVPNFNRLVVSRLSAIQQVFNTDVVPFLDRAMEYRLEFDTTEYETVSQAQSQQLSQAFRDGAVAMNEYREKLGLSPLDTGDVLYIPSNTMVISVDAVGSIQPMETYEPLENNAEINAEADVIEETTAAPETSPNGDNDTKAAQFHDYTYNGVSCQATRRRPSSRDDKKYERDVRYDGSERLVHYGDPNMDMQRDNEERRENFLARHNCDEKTDPFAAGFWACLDWQRPSEGKEYTIDKELMSWRAYALRNGTRKAVERFTPDHIPYGIAQQVRAVLDGLTDKDAIAKVFAEFGYHKAIQATRLDYEGALEDMFLEAVAGNINRRRAELILRSETDRAIDRAFRDGLADGGATITDVDMTDDEFAWIDNWKREQRQFINNVLDAIYKDEKVTEQEAQGKPKMWFNKSVFPAYYEGLSRANANGVYEWVLGPTEESCPSCLALSGQRRRMSFWDKNIKPQSDELACKGFNCLCNLTPTDAPVTRGRLPNWRKSIDITCHCGNCEDTTEC